MFNLTCLFTFIVTFFKNLIGQGICPFLSLKSLATLKGTTTRSRSRCIFIKYTKPQLRSIGGLMSKKTISHNYFKHANDASYGCSIQLLFEKKAYRAVCLYWYVLERLSAQNIGDTLELSCRHVASTLRTDCRGVANDLRTCSEQVGSFRYELVGNLLRISVDNFLKLQGRGSDTRQDKTIKEKKRQPVISKEVEKLAEIHKLHEESETASRDVLAAPILSPSVTRGDPVNGLNEIEREQCFYKAQSLYGYSPEFCQKAYEDYLTWALGKNQLVSSQRFLGWLNGDITRGKWKKIEKEYKDIQEVKAMLAEWEKDCPSQRLTADEARMEPADVTIRL